MLGINIVIGKINKNRKLVYLLSTIVSNIQKLESEYDNRIQIHLDDCELCSCESCYRCDNMHLMGQCQGCNKFWCHDHPLIKCECGSGDTYCRSCYDGNNCICDVDAIIVKDNKLDDGDLKSIVLDNKNILTFKLIVRELYAHYKNIKLRLQLAEKRIHEFNNV